MKSFTQYFAIIPAAGSGTRMKAAVPKQYLRIDHQTILEYTLNTLLHYERFNKCVIVIQKTDPYWKEIHFKHPKLLCAWGGEARVHSVYNGLMALKSLAKKNDWILVHDAVRPFLKTEDIDELIDKLKHHAVGGLLGSPVHNTLKIIDKTQHIIATLDRKKVWQALTPQMFRFHWLCQALESALKNDHLVTDESQAIELLGQQPKMIEGRADNIKITQPSDLQYFHCLQRPNSIKK